MRLYDISQLPVLDNGRLVGLIDEWDILTQVRADADRFRLPVDAAMTREVITLPKEADEATLLRTFGLGHVAVVMDGTDFLGLITRADVLNTWRNRLLSKG